MHRRLGDGCKKLTERVAEALWVADYDSLPWEYIEFRLCRDVFHCLPSELDDEPWENIRRTLAFIDAEVRAKVRR